MLSETVDLLRIVCYYPMSNVSQSEQITKANHIETFLTV